MSHSVPGRQRGHVVHLKVVGSCLHRSEFGDHLRERCKNFPGQKFCNLWLNFTTVHERLLDKVWKTKKEPLNRSCEWTDDHAEVTTAANAVWNNITLDREHLTRSPVLGSVSIYLK